MSSDLIINFNGYFTPNDQYEIKELSMYELEVNTSNVESNFIFISKPEIPWENLDSESKSCYEKYLGKHGVPWKFGTHSIDEIYDSVFYSACNSVYIYVLNEEQKILLLDFLSGNEDLYEIICLEDLGYDVPLKTSTTCKYHQQGAINNCANNNLEDMMSWLKASGFYSVIKRTKMHFVIDFIGYDLPHGVYGIKEFCAVFLNHRGSVKKSYHELVTPPFDKEDLPLGYQISYDYFNDIYGIPWDSGDLDYHEVSAIFKELSKNGTYIYVRNLAQKKLLKEFIGDDVEIVALNKFGFNYPPKMTTICLYHKRGKYNCAADNSWKMVGWLKNNELYKPNQRKNLFKQ